MYGQTRNGHGYGNMGGGNGLMDEDYDPFGEGYRNNDRYGTPPPPASIPSASYGAPPPPPAQSPARAMSIRGGRGGQTRVISADQQISQVLGHIRSEWPSMCADDCIPVQLALQLLDDSSVGRAHEYRKFRKSHDFLQDSLKNIVHEHHQGFNSSIGTFHKIQGSIQTSQQRVRTLRESLASAKTSLCSTDLELKKLSTISNEYDDLLQALNELDELRAVPDQLEARVSEKRFLTAVEVLQNALRKLRRPDLDNIGALADLKSYLENQETSLLDVLVEELHEHLYLKSPYCQERWQSLAKSQGAGAYAESFGNTDAGVPFHMVLDSIEVEKAVAEDPMKNPEADTFYYVSLLVEALNKLGRLQNAVEMLKQRLPVELFAVVNETINEVDQRHPSSLRGSSSKQDGLQIYGTRDTQLRADVIYDLLRTLYGKFEAIGEGHRVFHESIKALIRREGAGNNSALLGSFRELWNLYQNEIKSLLHNYVTTDADVYHQAGLPSHGSLSILDSKREVRENLFKFAEADAKSTVMATEYDALEEIIQATVPGLTSGTSKKSGGGAGGTGDKKGGGRGAGAQDTSTGSSRRGGSLLPPNSTTQLNGTNGQQTLGSYKSLVEPSVFNMSLLLPPTLVFLQRLRSIVPPGSDLAGSALTTFLDNFLVNVFHPQLDETIGKLCDSVFGAADAFSQDPQWSKSARRPVFRGTTAFFEVVTAFCRMLGTIPPDQALSSLIVTQMVRYYDRCFSWFRSMVAKAQEQQSVDTQNMRTSARFALEPGEIHDVLQDLRTAADEGSSGEVEEELYRQTLDKEVDLLIQHSNKSPLHLSDIIQDRETISSLCLLYTSMKWLSVKVSSLREITALETDSARPGLHGQTKRWMFLHDGKAASSASNAEQRAVRLPMTEESVQAFDSVVSSYEELASTALLALHMEIRCRIIYSLHQALSPQVAPFLLEQEVREPDPQILHLNSELALFDETVVQFLRDREVTFVRRGLALLINNCLVRKAGLATPMNAHGCGRMQLNTLVLQQNLKNVEEGVDLARAADYYALFEKGPDGIMTKAREIRQKRNIATPASITSQSQGAYGKIAPFTFEELKALMELCFSAQLANSERGIAASAKRQLEGKLLDLREQLGETSS